MHFTYSVDLLDDLQEEQDKGYLHLYILNTIAIQHIFDLIPHIQ